MGITRKFLSLCTGGLVASRADTERAAARTGATGRHAKKRTKLPQEIAKPGRSG